MNNNRKISVIVPVYNVEKYLERCLNSLLNQTYRNLEIILINDGSTDSSEDICKKYSKQNERIIFINQKNKGIAETRNTGIKYSTGEYIAFLDSDDWIDLNAYDTLLKAAIRNNSDIVVCGHKRVYENKKIESISKFKYETNLNNYEALEANFKGKITTVLWDKLYKRSLFIDNEIEFPKKKCFEDQMPNIEAINNARIITVIPDCLIFYFQRNNSITNSSISSVNFELFDELESIKLYLKNKGIYSNLKDSYQCKCINLIMGFIFGKFNTLSLNEMNELYLKKIKSKLIKYSKGYSRNKSLNFKIKLKIFSIIHVNYLYFFLYNLKTKKYKLF